MSTMSNSKQEEVKVVKTDSYQFDASDLTDDCLLALDEDAKEIIESNTYEPKVPIFYPSTEGKYVIRIFPDKDRTGRLRIIKRVFMHYLIGLDKEGREVKFRVINSPVIDKELNNAESQGMDDAFKHRKSEYGYVMVRLYECPQSDYLKPNSDGILVLNRKQLNALSVFYKSLDRNDKIRVLDASKSNYAITMNCKGGGFKADFNEIKFSGERELGSMMLPEGIEWKGLDHAYINENDNQITEEQLRMFKRYLSRKLAPVNGSIRDPLEESGSYTPSTSTTSTVKSPQPTSQPVNSSSTTSKSCTIVENKQENIGDPVKFGKPPADGDDRAHFCMECPNQIDCMKEAGLL